MRPSSRVLPVVSALLGVALPLVAGCGSANGSAGAGPRSTDSSPPQAMASSASASVASPDGAASSLASAAQSAVQSGQSSPPASANSARPTSSPVSTTDPTVYPTAASPTTFRSLPSKDQWLADIHRAMAGARAYLKSRTANADEKLGINLDIDNTSLATQYGGGAVPEILRFTRFAQRHHVAVLFNTGRYESSRASTTKALTSAGYLIDELCLHQRGVSIISGKQACRQHFADEGYVLVENIGNRSTDFVGSGYERGYKLPDYGGLLG